MRLLEDVGGPGGDLAGEGRGGDGEGTREVEATGAGTTLEVPVDGRDAHLVGIGRYTGAGTDAGTTTGVDDVHTHTVE